MLVSLLVDNSFADTESNPSASIWKVTRIFAAPATMGGIFVKVKFASDLQSDTRSRSPCNT